MKKTTLLILMALLLAFTTFALAACQQPAPASAPSPTAAPKPTTAPAPSPTAAAKPADPIIFGAPVSLAYAVGADGVRAAVLATEQINAKGGVTVGGVKRQIQIKEIDSRAMAPGVPTADSLLAYENLMQYKPVAFAMSAERSEVTLAAMDLVAKYKIPHMIPSAKSPAITQKVKDNYDTYKWNFRTTLNSVYLADFTRDQFLAIEKEFGFNSVYFISEDAAWAKGTIDALVPQLEKANWKILGKEYAPLGATDYSMALVKAKNSGAKILGIMFSNPEGGQLIDQASTMQIPALVVGMSSPTVAPTAWDIFKGKVEYACLSVSEIGNVPLKTVPESQAFYDAFVKRWGKGPEVDSVPAPAYDAVYALAAAIEKANSLEGEALVKALETTDLKGATGRVRFDKATHQAVYGTDPKETALAALVQWQKPGERVVVWPPAAATGKIQLPPWVKK